MSFRNPGVAGYPKTAHYRNPYAVARAFIRREHNEEGER